MPSGIHARAAIGRAGIAACTLLSIALVVDVISIGSRLRSRQVGTRYSALRFESRTGPRSGDSPTLVQRVIASHLFGKAQIEGAVTASIASPLLLAGTIATGNPRSGFGIMGHSLEDAHVYPAGAALPGGERLYGVYSDHVTLEHNGQFETLRFPDDRRARVARTRPRRSVVADGAAIDSSAPEPRAATYRPQTVFERLGADPSWDADGHFRGFRVNPSPKVRRDLGLRPDDLLLAIDGVALKNPQDAQLVAQQDQPPGSLTVERDGQALLISLVR